MLAINHLQGLDQRLVVQTSDGQSAYLLVGRRGNYIKISSSAYYLLRNIHQGRSFEQIAEQLSRQRGTPVGAAEVEVAYEQVVAQITAIENKAPQSAPGFWVRTRLLPAQMVQHISGYFAWLFHPMVAAVIIAAMLVMLVLGLRTFGMVHILTLEGEQMSSFLSIYGLFLLSLVFHELGHASACTRFGVRPNEIGFAFYWIYPALYTNVNAAWQLNRRQRVVVDLAGVFFQLIAGTIYLFFAWLYHWDIGLKAFTMVLHVCMFMMNPFFRFDGYWVVADALGITNFAQELRRILRVGFDRLRGKPTATLPWPTYVLALIGVYVLAGIGFWLYFLSWAGPEIVSALLDYPTHFVDFFEDMRHGAITVEHFDSILFPTFVVVGVLLMLARLTQWLGRSITRHVSAPSGQI
jgi:putative peptide zinc metalloprotease protein